MVRVLVPDALASEGVHAAHLHVRVEGSSRLHHHLVLSHHTHTRHVRLVLTRLVLLLLLARLVLHVLKHFVQASDDVVGLGLWSSRCRLLWLLLLLLHLHLVVHHELLLDALLHGLLHLLLHQHGVVLVVHHSARLLGEEIHRVLRLLLLRRLGLLSLCWLRAASHHVEQVDLCSWWLLLTRSRRLTLFVLLTRATLACVDVARVEHSVLLVLARDELLWLATLLDRSVPLERLMKIIVDDQTHGQDFFVVDLGDHIDQLGLELSESPEQVIQRITLLAGRRLIDNLVREVDVALDEVHVVDELFKLFRDRFRA